MLPGITPALTTGGSAGHRIERSLVFRSHVSTYLSRSVVAGANRRVGTYSVWLKRAKLIDGYLMEAFISVNDRTVINIASDQLYFQNLIAAAVVGRIACTPVLRDPSAWMHICVNWNTPASANAVTFYINGVQMAATVTTTVAQNSILQFGNIGVALQNGRHGGASTYLDASKAEEYLIDGYAHPASMFGQFNTKTNVWEPKPYKGLFGASGGYWNFADNSAITAATLGKDSSGMSNLLTYSDAFGSAPWAPGNNAVLTGGQADPLGGTGAFKFAVGANTDGPSVYAPYNYSVGQTTHTVYVKPAPTTQAFAVFNGTSNGGHATFNLASKSFATYLNGTGSGVSAAISDAGNGWSKCSVTVTHNTAGTDYPALQVYGSTVNGEGVYIFRSDLTLGSIVPTELQYTAGTAVANKNFTPSAFVTLANLPHLDSPTGYTESDGKIHSNYCIWNPNDSTTLVNLYDGNAYVQGNSATLWGTARGSIFVKTGKWYWEALVAGIGGGCMVGIMTNANTLAGRTDSVYCGMAGFIGYGYNSTGPLYRGPLSTSGPYGATFTTNDIIGVALDMDAGTLTFYKNGVSQGVAVTGLTDWWAPALSALNSGGWTANFGAKAIGFVHSVPAGHKALCTENLPMPTIQKPEQYFDVNTRTATGAAFLVGGKSFQPDLVWIKGRNSGNNHAWYDATRGATKEISSSENIAETTQVQGVTAFNSDGFSAGTYTRINTAAATYVDWMWKDSTDAGFDIVPYVGTGVARTIPHMLGAVPQLMIIKNRSAVATWRVYHEKANTNPQNGAMYLNLTSAWTTDATDWNNTKPTSSVFTVGTAVAANGNGNNIIAYLFTSVPGFSHIGSYNGNANVNGPFVWCGFKPKWLLLKWAAGVGSWHVRDAERNPINPATLIVLPESAAVESASAAVDFLSNGFKVRGSGSGTNGSGELITFAAFAEYPFKYARAR